MNATRLTYLVSWCACVNVSRKVFAYKYSDLSGARRILRVGSYRRVDPFLSNSETRGLIIDA